MSTTYERGKITYQQGLDANKSGDASTAKRLFLEAHELAPAAIHLLSAANMCLKLGEYEEARTHYNYLLRVPLDDDIMRHVQEKLSDPRLALRVSIEFYELMKQLFNVLATEGSAAPQRVVEQDAIQLCCSALEEGAEIDGGGAERSAIVAFVNVLLCMARRQATFTREEWLAYAPASDSFTEAQERTFTSTLLPIFASEEAVNGLLEMMAAMKEAGGAAEEDMAKDMGAPLYSAPELNRERRASLKRLSLIASAPVGAPSASPPPQAAATVPAVNKDAAGDTTERTQDMRTTSEVNSDSSGQAQRKAHAPQGKWVTHDAAQLRAEADGGHATSPPRVILSAAQGPHERDGPQSRSSEDSLMLSIVQCLSSICTGIKVPKSETPISLVAPAPRPTCSKVVLDSARAPTDLV